MQVCFENAFPVLNKKKSEALAATIKDPNEKKRILDNAYAVKSAAEAVIAAARRVAANPNDPNAKADLDAAYKALQQKLSQAKYVPGSGPTPASSGSANDLVQAAQEEAEAALQLAAEAGKKPLSFHLKKTSYSNALCR
jgi:hypothetical protein